MGHAVDVEAKAFVAQMAGASGLALATATMDAASGTVSASAGVMSNLDPLYSAIGTTSLTGAGHAVAAAGGRAGGAMPAADGAADATFEVHTGLDSGDLRGVYDGNRDIRQAFAGDLEGTAEGRFSETHTEANGVQTVTSSLQLRLIEGRLEAPGDTVIGLFGGEAHGGGFDSLHFEVFANDVNVVTLMSQDFTDAASATTFFDDHAVNLGDLSQYTDWFGNVFVTVQVTATFSHAGDGFSAGVLFADVGGQPVDPSAAVADASALAV